MKAVVKKQGRNWGVYIGDRLVEGGFFSRTVAVACRDRINASSSR